MVKSLITLLILISLCSVSYADIDFDKLTIAIIEVESGGDPNAYSGYAYGLMQVSPIVLKEYNYTEHKWDYGKRIDSPIYNIGDLYNPQINVEIGEWYISRLFHYYKCTELVDILAAYNGGITRWNRVGRDLKKMPSETRSYVDKVLRIYKEDL